MIACSSNMFRAARRVVPSLLRQASRGRSKGPLLPNLTALIDAGVLQKDEAQIELASRMSDLQGVMANYVPPPPPPPRPLRPAILDADDYLDEDTSAAAVAWRADQKAAKLEYETGVAEYEAAVARAFAATPRGLYVWGDVGTGKSMLMDLFFETCELPDATVDATNQGSSSVADKNPLSAVLASLIPSVQPDSRPRKRRVHFHQFMLELHRRIHATKQAQLAAYGRSRTGQIDFRPDRDALRLVAADIAAEAHLLAFDEFQVTDVADALIMVQVFDELWKRGTVVVATSNRPPKDLYLGGINREYFMPFIGALEARCAEHSLGAASAGSDSSSSSSASTRTNNDTATSSSSSSSSATKDSALSSTPSTSRDYRQLAAAEPMPGAYTWPLHDDDEERMTHLLKYLCSSSNSNSAPAPMEVPVMMGRQLKVPEGSLEAGVCAFSFEDLCNRELGAADYKALCDHFDTVLLYGVPVLTLNDHNQARRFVTLIDELYEHQLRLIVAAAAPPSSLFAHLEQHERPVSGRGTDRPGGPSAQQPIPSASAAGPGGGQAGVDAAQCTVVRTGELASVQELEFAFKRASSRLTEMSGRPYHAQHSLKWPNAVPLPENQGAFEK